MKKFKTVLAILLAYITVTGLVTFSLFILEESFQTVMFGTWPAQDAKQWHVVYNGLQLMQGIQKTGKWVNYTCGWIQPLAFISYHKYFAVSAQFYIDGLKAKCLAHAPELFVGQEIEISFKPTRVVQTNSGQYSCNAGRIHVISDIKPEFKFMVVKGILEEINGKLLIKQRLRS